jgi:hypothetical protein
MNYPINTKYIEIRGNKHETKEFITQKIIIGQLEILKLQTKNKTIYFGTKNLKNLIKIKEIRDETYNELTGEIESKIVGYDKTTSVISIEDKDYCFEIFSHESGLKINFITTNKNKGCSIEDEECKSLNYLFSVIYELLTRENFEGSLYLEDDSIINDCFTIIFNLVNGKDSIYCKYGFEYSERGLQIINKHKEDLLSFQNYLYNNNYPLRTGKIDDNYKRLLKEFEKENGKIGVRDIPMILPSFGDYIKNYQRCKFNSTCAFKLEEEIGSQQSLELEEEIEQPGEEDYELSLISEYNNYLQNFLRSNKKINEDLFPLNLNVNKLDIEIKKNMIRLFFRLLNNYGLSLKLRPLRIVDKEKPKLWIKKNSSDYILIKKILAFYLLTGMKKLSILFLQTLLKLHKQNKELITEDDFKKWNKIIGAYYGSC